MNLHEARGMTTSRRSSGNFVIVVSKSDKNETEKMKIPRMQV